VPVLTEQAIHRAAFIEYGQVVASGMFRSITNPICHTICGQWIAIVFQQTMTRCSCEIYQPAILNFPQSTKTFFIFTDPALIGTVITGYSFPAFRRIWRKTKCGPCGGMNSTYFRLKFRKLFFYTACTNIQCCRYNWG